MSSNAVLFKPYKILKSALASTPIREGQFILCTDTGEIYVDKDSTTRVQMGKDSTTVKTFTLAANAWSKSGNIYTATIVDADVTANSLTDIAIDSTTYSIAENAEVKPYTTEVAGGIQLFASSAPTGAISGKYIINGGNA